MTDFGNWPDMRPVLQDGKLSSGVPMKKGETFHHTLDVPGQRVELRVEVTGYEPNESLSLKYEWESLHLDVNFSFGPANEPDGTLLTGTGKGKMGGFSRLLEPFVSHEINREVASNFDNIKNHLESQKDQ